MKKNILALTISLLGFTYTMSGQQVNDQFEDFLANIEEISLEELEKEIDRGIEGLDAMAGFFNYAPGEIKTYTAEEEQFSEPFKIDTSVVEKAMKQFNNIGFLQTFKEDKAHLKFQKVDDDYWNRVSLGEGIEEWLTPTKIHFKDGTTTTGIDHEVSFFWDTDWGTPKPIDKVEIEYGLTYLKAYDSLTLPKNTNKLTYENGQIKIKKRDQNHLYLTISDAYADRLYLRAFNKNGKPLNVHSSSSSPTSDKESNTAFNEIVGILKEVQTRFKNKKFKDATQVKTFLLKKASKLREKKDTDEVRHLKFFFSGNIDEIRLYLATEEGTQKGVFTATNTSPFNTILLMENKEHLVFMNAKAEELFRIDHKPLQQVSDRFFKEDTTYYHLNLKTKNLDQIEAVKIFSTGNGLKFIQPKYENGFLAFNDELQKLSDIEFSNVWNVDNEYAHTLGLDQENYSIDAKGTLKKIEGVTEIGELSDGLLAAKSNGKYGFIAASGNVIIPFIYEDAEVFSEGLAYVMNKEGFYGYINTKGEIVLPFIYDKARSFENGITLVTDANGYHLIDAKGTIMASYKGGYSISGSGTEKTYQLGDKTYDAFGKLIEE